MKKQGTRTMAALASVVCAIGLLAGCSGSSEGGEASDEASSVATNSGDYALNLAQCLRDKGFDVSDPDSEGNMKFPEDPAIDQAITECESTLGPAPGSEDLSDPQVQADLVKAAQCLREAGYDVPDPTADKGLELNGEIPQETLDKCFSGIGEGK